MNMIMAYQYDNMNMAYDNMRTIMIITSQNMIVAIKYIANKIFYSEIQNTQEKYQVL